MIDIYMIDKNTTKVEEWFGKAVGVTVEDSKGQEVELIEQGKLHGPIELVQLCHQFNKTCHQRHQESCQGCCQ